MTQLPTSFFSGEYASGGHVQGVAIDKARGYAYYSFTTMLLKTDLLGNPVGSVVRLAGHLGCITYDEQNNAVYGSLELKHDSIGAGIINKTGWNPSEEDSFYLVSFDCDAIVRMDMDAETDNVMKAVYLADVVKDYAEIDEVSGKEHRYGCSGIDGTALGPVFGAAPDSEKKIMIAYGVYGDVERTDNDHQVILQYDTSVIARYGKPLNQTAPHHSGPEHCEKRYFFYTGNTTFGVQNLEYDPWTRTWFVAVYVGKKPEYENFTMFFIDGTIAATEVTLEGRKGEKGSLLTSARYGVCGKQKGIYGSMFPYGQTGMVSLGDGIFYFSHHGRNQETKAFNTHVVRYQFSENDPNLFVPAE